MGRVCEKAGKVRVADVVLVMRIVWHYQVSSTSTTTSKSTSTAASSAEGFTPLWRRVLGSACLTPVNQVTVQDERVCLVFPDV